MFLAVYPLLNLQAKVFPGEDIFVLEIREHFRTRGRFPIIIESRQHIVGSTFNVPCGTFFNILQFLGKFPTEIDQFVIEAADGSNELKTHYVDEKIERDVGYHKPQVTPNVAVQKGVHHLQVNIALNHSFP